MGKFTLEIDLGNDAMQNPDDIAWALHNQVEEMLDLGYRGGNIRDANGQTVGKWQIS